MVIIGKANDGKQASNIPISPMEISLKMASKFQMAPEFNSIQFIHVFLSFFPLVFIEPYNILKFINYFAVYKIFFV